MLKIKTKGGKMNKKCQWCADQTEGEEDYCERCIKKGIKRAVEK